jgi:hypothetical protein
MLGGFVGSLIGEGIADHLKKNEKE